MEVSLCLLPVNITMFDFVIHNEPESQKQFVCFISQICPLHKCINSSHILVCTLWMHLFVVKENMKMRELSVSHV